MTLINCYTSLDALKGRLGLPASNTASDEILEGIIESVSRAIDDEVETQFYAETQTLYYTATDRNTLVVDDLLSVTTLKTDDNADGTYETTWASTDFELAPYNAQSQSTPRPYTRIELANNGSYCFPVGVRKGVQVLCSRGFCTAANQPRRVETVCQIECVRAYHALKHPFGTATSEGGAPTVIGMGLLTLSKRMLDPFRRVTVG
jgi:hypothetical protein